MVNLKSRIEDLKKATGSLTVKELCESSLAKLAEINEMRASNSAKAEIENGIIEKLIANLKEENDVEAKKFVEREERFFTINNLGVKTAIQKIAESDLAGHPALRYTIEAFSKQVSLPEYMIAEEFVRAMHAFEWHPVVKEMVTVIRENANSNKEDFIIHKAIYNIKNSRSSYILSGINESIEDYLVNRTSASKARLVEKLNKFMFDPMVRELASAIRESEAGLQVNAASRSAKASKVYSAVAIKENSEIFAIGNDFYEKSGEEIHKITVAEAEAADKNFVALANFISQPVVAISEGTITIFAHQKKVILTKENEEVNISINGNKATRQDFNKIFTNAGVFRPGELKIMEGINLLIENFNSIVEIEFAKRIESSLVENRRIDVIRLGDKIYVTKNDPSMGESSFFKNLNAVQTRKLVNEFLSYDLSESFADMLSKEEADIRAIEETKKAYIQTIGQLEEKMTDLKKITDKVVLESDEFKAVVKVIEDEITSLKAEYNDYVAKIHTKTEITSANEEELTPGKQEADPSDKFRVDDRVKVEGQECEGTITGLEDAGNTVVVLCDNGETVKTTADKLTKVEAKNESEIEIKVDGKKIEIDSEEGEGEGEGDDDDEEGEGEGEEKEAKSKEEDDDDKIISTEESVKANEDHAAAGEKPESDTAAFTAEDRVETKDGKYGTVTGVSDTTGEVTVLLDGGETITVAPDQLIIVKEKGVDESEGAGDKVKLKADGRVATIQGKSEADNTLTVVTDDGETLVVKAGDIEVIDDLSGQEEEKVKGQQNNGTSVEVQE